jgi:diacylglycerol kinase family enzyme
VPYQIDGDVMGSLPVEITIDPQPLRVRVPAAGRP